MKINRIAVLILANIVLFLALLEVMARIFYSSPFLAKYLTADDDYTRRREWVSRHHNEGVQIDFSFERYDAATGWRPKPNLRNAKENAKEFEDKILNTNSMGFRGQDDFPMGRKKGKKRIVILGDSFTFGSNVSDHETYAHLLQSKLPDVEVFNLGVGGWGHDQMLVLFKELGVKYQPDIVIVGFISGDMDRNMLSFRSFAKPRYRLCGGNLELTGTPVPTPEHVLKWDWARPRVVDVVSGLWRQIEIATGRYEEKKLRITAAILHEISEIAQSAGAVPLFAFLPTSTEIYSPDTPAYQNFLFSICAAQKGTQCMSAYPDFARKVANGQSFKPGHWSTPGHETVAEAIYAYLGKAGHIGAR